MGNVGGGSFLIVAGGLALYIVASGFTKNLNAAWNSLRGVGQNGALPGLPALPSAISNGTSSLTFPPLSAPQTLPYVDPFAGGSTAPGLGIHFG